MKSAVSKLLANARDRRTRGFTLIELLIVIGILGILVVAVLLTLNPGEAQRKARDAVRMKDLATLQTIMDQFANSGVSPSSCMTAIGGCTTGAASPNQTCAAGWLGVNVCTYATTLPIDPNNNGTQARNVAGDGADADTTCGNDATPPQELPIYRVRTNTAGNEYEINVIQESNSNCPNVMNDGGNSRTWVETGTDQNLDLL